jgi:tight adherence protein B
MVNLAHPGGLLCAGVALIAWPAPRRATARVRAFLPPANRPQRNVGRLRVRRGPFVAVGSLLALVLFGPVGTLAVGLLVAAVVCHRRGSRRIREQAADAQAMAEAIRTMVAGLRAGAPAAPAAESAAAEASGPAAATMKTLAVTARLGGDLPMRRTGAPSSDQQAVAKAWSLSRRHGLPLADLLDAVRRDIVAAARAPRRINAGMAGARASAVVLAVLPGLGLLLGEAMGAGGLHVLTGTPAGRLLMLVGSAFILGGVVWSARLTNPGSLP